MNKVVQEQLPGSPKYSRRAILRGALLMSGAYTATLLAACQPAGQSGASTTPAGGSAAATVRVWGYGLDDARAKARLASLKKSNPNIPVSPVGGDLNPQQLLTAVASGDPPEVVNVDRVETGSWAGRGAIDPIDDLV